MFLYEYIKNNEVIYIGKTTRDINLRINEHKNKKDLPDDAEIYVYKCDSEAYMNVMEILLIDEYRPKYNKDCHPMGWEKANIYFKIPCFIPLQKYNEQNVPLEYKRNIKGSIMAIMSDGIERKPKYCCCDKSIPEVIYNENGYIYEICHHCGKLIKGSFRDVDIGGERE